MLIMVLLYRLVSVTLVVGIKYKFLFFILKIFFLNLGNCLVLKSIFLFINVGV